MGFWESETAPSAHPLPPLLSFFRVHSEFRLDCIFFWALVLSVWPHNSLYLTDVPLVFRPLISGCPLGSSEAPLFLSGAITNSIHRVRRVSACGIIKHGSGLPYFLFLWSICNCHFSSTPLWFNILVCVWVSVCVFIWSSLTSKFCTPI